MSGCTQIGWETFSPQLDIQLIDACCPFFETQIGRFSNTSKEGAAERGSGICLRTVEHDTRLISPALAHRDVVARHGFRFGLWFSLCGFCKNCLARGNLSRWTTAHQVIQIFRVLLWMCLKSNRRCYGVHGAYEPKSQQEWVGRIVFVDCNIARLGAKHGVC